MRIAVTTAKVLADTEKIDLVGVSSLAVLARNVVPTSSAIIVPFFDARRGNVFAGAYQWENGKLVNKIEDQHLGIDILLEQLAKLGQQVVLVGQMTDKIQAKYDQLPANVTLLPRAYSIPSTYQLALAGKMKEPVKEIAPFVPTFIYRITEAEANWQKLHPGEKERIMFEKFKEWFVNTTNPTKRPTLDFTRRVVMISGHQYVVRMAKEQDIQTLVEIEERIYGKPHGVMLLSALNYNGHVIGYI